jgi:uncharacterized membrane protein
VYTPGGNTKLGGEDVPGHYGVERTPKRVRIVWHYRASDEQRTFTISYRFRGLAVAYDDVVDVFLDVWGDQWPVGLSNLSAEVELPQPATLGPEYRVYGHPAWVRGVVARAPRVATLRAVSVPSHQFVAFRVVFPRSVLNSTGGALTSVTPKRGLPKIIAEEREGQAAYLHDRAKLDDAKRHFGRTLGYLALIGLVPALVLVALTWLVFGRERRTAYDREYEQEPPTDSPPALVPPLLRQQTEPGSLEWTATLFDLIRRGRFKSTPVTTERKIWGGLRHEQVSDLQVEQGSTEVETTPFENALVDVVDDVLADGPVALSKFRDHITEHKTENSKRFTAFKERVGTAIRARTWYVGTGARMLGLAIAAFAAVSIVLLWVAIDGWRAAAPRWHDVVMAALGGCAVANAAVLVGAATRVRLWRRRTGKGEEEAQRWEAFRRYLTDFPRLQEAPPATLELWERFLVYGIAFGIAERVLQAAHLHMPEEMHDRSTIYWISPNGDLGSGASALAIGDLSSGFGSALAPPSSGAGGSFGGGGGGRGGGGGGAW